MNYLEEFKSTLKQKCIIFEFAKFLTINILLLDSHTEFDDNKETSVGLSVSNDKLAVSNNNKLSISNDSNKLSVSDVKSSVSSDDNSNAGYFTADE